MSRSHQRAEHILKNLQQEEEKRRLGREASIITAIPVVQEACYEPTCSPPPEQEEEGGAVSHQRIRKHRFGSGSGSSGAARRLTLMLTFPNETF